MPLVRNVVLLDTNVVGYRFGKSPLYEPFKKSIENSIPAISFITYGECIKGALLATWGQKRRSEYEAHLRKYLLIPSTKQLSLRYAELASLCEKRGICVSDDNDMWIAATAHLYDIQLATNDHAIRAIPGIRFVP